MFVPQSIWRREKKCFGGNNYHLIAGIENKCLGLGYGLWTFEGSTIDCIAPAVGVPSRRNYRAARYKGINLHSFCCPFYDHP